MAKKKKEDITTSDWDLVVAGLGKKFGSGLSLFQVNSGKVQVLGVEALPTHLPALDEALGIFGFPRGRAIEVFGLESSGKSTLALQAVVSAQKQFPDKPVLYVDLEHALEIEWMKRVGVNFDKLWVSQPDSGEDATQLILTAIESGHPSLVVLDSVAAIVPQAELDGEMSDLQMGAGARIMGKFCRKVSAPLQKSQATLLCINQIRMKLGPRPGETRPGGNALKYLASQVLRIRKEGDIKVGNEVVGIWVEVVVKKNKVAPPLRTARIPLLFDRGFCPAMSLLDVGATAGIVEKSGAWYSYKGERLGQGIYNAMENLTEGQFNEIYDAFKTLRTSGVEVLEEIQEEEGVSENV